MCLECGAEFEGTIGCAVGPCIDSAQRDGLGCTLCDKVAKLPQPFFRKSDEATDRDKQQNARINR